MAGNQSDRPATRHQSGKRSRANPPAIALKHGQELVNGKTAHFQRVQQLGYPLTLANRRQ
jgi:hypothetical protein